MQRLFRPQTPFPDGRTDLVLLPSWEVGFDELGPVRAVALRLPLRFFGGWSSIRPMADFTQPIMAWQRMDAVPVSHREAKRRTGFGGGTASRASRTSKKKNKGMAGFSALGVRASQSGGIT